ncbi:MAG: hypothetical protein ACRDZ1_11870 [Acidimicrobiia bacterium]
MGWSEGIRGSGSVVFGREGAKIDLPMNVRDEDLDEYLAALDAGWRAIALVMIIVALALLVAAAAALLAFFELYPSWLTRGFPKPA